MNMGADLRRIRKTCALAMYAAHASRNEIIAVLRCGRSAVRRWRSECGQQRSAERDQSAIDRAIAAYRADLEKLEAQQSAQAKLEAEAKLVAKAEASERRKAEATRQAEARAAEATKRREKQDRGYVCPADCTCLLCQLAEKDDASPRRTGVFALRLDLG